MGNIRTGGWVIGSVLTIGAFVLFHAWWTTAAVAEGDDIVGNAIIALILGFLLLLASTFVPDRSDRAQPRGGRKK